MILLYTILLVIVQEAKVNEPIQAAAAADKDELLAHQTELSTSLQGLVDNMRKRIFHTLYVTPYITRAMIQVGLGPGTPPELWSPILEELVRDGEILFKEVQTEAPSSRSLLKGIYYLPSMPYPPVNINDLEALRALKTPQA